MALSKKPVTGMKDILPEEMQIRDYVIGVIKETYGKFGFTSIETPCMENIANLSNKQGGENEKLIFKVLKRGEKLDLENAKEEIQNAENPEELYLFNPTHGLDVEATERLYSRLEGLAKKGTKIIIGKTV